MHDLVQLLAGWTSQGGLVQCREAMSADTRLIVAAAFAGMAGAGSPGRERRLVCGDFFLFGPPLWRWVARPCQDGATIALTGGVDCGPARWYGFPSSAEQKRLLDALKGRTIDA